MQSLRLAREREVLLEVREQWLQRYWDAREQYPEDPH